MIRKSSSHFTITNTIQFCALILLYSHFFQLLLCFFFLAASLKIWDMIDCYIFRINLLIFSFNLYENEIFLSIWIFFFTYVYINLFPLSLNYFDINGLVRFIFFTQIFHQQKNKWGKTNVLLHRSFFLLYKNAMSKIYEINEDDEKKGIHLNN